MRFYEALCIDGPMRATSFGETDLPDDLNTTWLVQLNGFPIAGIELSTEYDRAKWNDVPCDERAVYVRHVAVREEETDTLSLSLLKGATIREELFNMTALLAERHGITCMRYEIPCDDLVEAQYMARGFRVVGRPPGYEHENGVLLERFCRPVSRPSHLNLINHIITTEERASLERSADKVALASGSLAVRCMVRGDEEPYQQSRAERSDWIYNTHAVVQHVLPRANLSEDVDTNVRGSQAFAFTESTSDAMIGSITLDRYSPKWSHDESGVSALYIRGLHVNLDHKGNGIGIEMLDWASEVAATLGYDVIRLEVQTDNKRLQEFYGGEYGMAFQGYVYGDFMSGALFEAAAGYLGGSAALSNNTEVFEHLTQLQEGLRSPVDIDVNEVSRALYDLSVPGKTWR